MRLLIAGGGTGGHVAPALAVARAWAPPESGEVLFIGAADGLEARMVPAAGYPIEFLSVSGIKGMGLFARIASIARLVPALFRSLSVLRRFRPAVAFGVGGYASGPAMIAAALSRTPRAILEPNSIPGLTNRILARLVHRCCVHFESTARLFPGGKVVRTGNPVRQEIVSAARETPEGRGLRRLLVFGGSQGARTINRAAYGAARILAENGSQLGITHQAGRLDLEEVRAAYADVPLDVDVVEFIEDMASAYRRADLAVCRSGASAVAELAAVGMPSILIPYPHAADDHQRHNAEELAGAGAAIVLRNEECTAERLAGLISELAAQPGRLRAMSEAALRLGRPDAAARVAEVCAGLARGGR